MEEIAKLPDFTGMSPNQMRKAWARFMADRDYWGNRKAEAIRLSIISLALNKGEAPAERLIRRKLDKQLEEFAGAA